jgi:subtilisin family serine protease
VIPSGIDRIDAEPGIHNVTGAGIGVAILDTGIDWNHGDLDVFSGFSAFDEGSFGQDDNGHGTHVAGIVAALNNNQDVVGVAPDSVLYAVKVLNSQGGGSDATVIEGLEWVAENAFDAEGIQNIHVVNMSLGRAGTLDDNEALRSAVQTLYDNGISIVVAAGNDCNAEVSDFVPATYPEVMAIASTTAQDGNSHNKFGQVIQDTASAFTTDGKFEVKNEYPEEPPIGVTISAPGESHENVSGAILELVGILSTQLDGGTTRMAGTSMSSPHAAGVVTLLYEQAGGTFHPEDARMALMSGVLAGKAPYDSPASCYTDDEDREGILNAESALGFLN